MNEFRIWINEKYQRNKVIIWFFILVVTLLLLVNYEMGKIRDSRTVAISENASNDSVQIQDKIREISNSNEEKNYDEVMKEFGDSKFEKVNYIELFIELCNAQKYDIAYELLTDDCKEVLYPTLEDFEENYYNIIFKTNKNYNIVDFKNDTYKVDYLESAIYSGREEDSGIQDYITVCAGGKLNISKFIGYEEMDVTSVSKYGSFKVQSVEKFLDWNTYTIVAKNNIKADIYIDDITSSNLYIENDQNGKFYIDSSEYIDQNFYIPSGNSKEIKLKFNIKDSLTNNSPEVRKIVFGNMKIVNKEYLDDTVTVYDEETKQYVYKMKKTNYPEYDSYTIEL